MNRNLLILLGISLLFGACARKPTETEEPSVRPSTSAPDEPAKVTIPEELMSAPLRALGAPFDKPITYKATGFDGGDIEITRTFTVKAVEGDKVTVGGEWKGSSQFGPESYEVTPEGIRVSQLLGNVIDPPVLYMPSDLSAGKQWTYEYTISNMGQQIKVSTTAKVIGTEKVSVPLGDFDAILIEETGTLSAEALNLTATGKTWLVNGVGVVKMTGRQRGKTGDQQVDREVEMLAIK